MLYTPDNIKYCLLTWDYFENQHVSQYISPSTPIPITGLFNWSILFNGSRTFPRSKTDFEKFNLLHVNVTQKNLPLLSKIIPLINQSVTKLLINIDYAIDMWSQTFPHPELLLQEIDKADYIFAVEPSMADLLSHSLKRKIACIPHPCPSHLIEKYRTHDRQKKIMISTHRYDSNFQLPYFATRDLPDKWYTSILGASNNIDSVLHLYDECQGVLTFEETIKYISRHYAIIETHTLNSYGRTTIEAAVLGVPCIGMKNLESMNRCFPTLIYNSLCPVTRIHKLINTLISDSDFYSSVCSFAIEKSLYYSYDNCKKLMLDFLNSPA